MELMKRLMKEEEGQGMVEYALIIALVAVLLVGTLLTFKDNIIDVFDDIQKGLQGTDPTTTNG